MKLLFLLIGLSLAFRAHAQEGTLPNKPVTVKLPPSLKESLRSTVNPRYMVLKEVTPAYHQATDTINGRYAFKLPPGMRVYIKEWLPDGVLIDFGFGERYYLPAKSVKGLQAFLEL